ncbi:MAG TPA: SIMPL domain-containing protein [Acidimicrobiia bacterium]|nr:SIMPL domain-containing protein [Acidimicrobiia bacterium]
MRRLLLLVAASAVALAACGTGEGAPSAGDGSSASGINVTGQGKVTGTPDTLTLTLGVSVLRPTVDAATADAAARAAAIIAALQAKGVAEQDIQTANYSIYPEYDYNGTTPRLTGYRVQNQLEVKIRQLDGAGGVIDAAAAAGGDDTVVNGLAFSIEDNSDMLQMARTAAWSDAEAKATQLAQLAGVNLGKAVTITENIEYDTPPIYYDRQATDSAGAATPIEPGQQEVMVTVQITFAIG